MKSARNNKQSSRKGSRFVYWTPRILSIVFLCFLALFSLDVFGNGLSVEQTILALLMHNIPVFILGILVWISWKYDVVGGVAFILFGVWYIVQIAITAMANGFEWYLLSWAVQISGIAFFIGILYLINWKKKK